MVKPMDVVALVAVVLVYSALPKRIRFSSIAMLAIASVPAVALWQAGGGVVASVAVAPAASSGAGGAAARGGGHGSGQSTQGVLRQRKPAQAVAVDGGINATRLM